MFKKANLPLLISLIFISLIVISFTTSILQESFKLVEKAEAESPNLVNNSEKKWADVLPSKSTAIIKKDISGVKSKYFVKKGKSNRRVIYLTFDDGPNQSTGEILATLKNENVKATFFMLYYNILHKPKTVQNAFAAGHAIGCHGVTHQRSKFYGGAQAPAKEMKSCSQAIQKTIGVKTKIVRVPYGSYPNLTLDMKRNLEKSNFKMWDWNVDSNDWRYKSSSADYMNTQIIKSVKAVHKSGKAPVILMHDKEVTAKALPKLIKQLKALNFEFEVLTEDMKPVQFGLKKG